MPQMAPMYWMFFMLLFLVVYYMYMNMIYSGTKSVGLETSFMTTLSSFSWKW